MDNIFKDDGYICEADPVNLETLIKPDDVFECILPNLLFPELVLNG